MRTGAWWVMVLAAVLRLPAFGAGEKGNKTSKHDEGLRAYLAQHPGADLNVDGVLTEEEWETHIPAGQLAPARVLREMPAGATHRHVMLSMRDGVKLATEIFLPPGDGPFPARVIRGAYDRWRNALAMAKQHGRKPLVLVTQSLRGDKDSGRNDDFDPLSFDNEIDDGFDTIEWLAAQPWCNGRVGMAGGSGNGFPGYMALLAAPPHLTVCHAPNSGGDATAYWFFHNGVRRAMYDWAGNRNMTVRDWPRPTLRSFDPGAQRQRLKAAAENHHSVFIADTGWYDIFSEAALDYFEAFGPKGGVFVRVDPRSHGAMIWDGKYPRHHRWPENVTFPDAVELLLDPGLEVPKRSTLVYYLMGDVTDRTAPGNTYKVTHVWPVPSTATRWYMQSNGGLTLSAPAEANAALTFRYDPRDPVPTKGGATLFAAKENKGPVDQRLLSKREDILRFYSEPLKVPVEVTGKILADLYISSDVQDTTFMVKLIDVYPDGYEALVRDSAVMARYWKGRDRPAPLEKRKVYRLRIDMWSTALVFNRGHRISVHVTSSNSPKYEAHPNTYEPVTSFDAVPVATNTVHVSTRHPSSIILPVVSAVPGLSFDS